MLLAPNCQAAALAEINSMATVAGGASEALRFMLTSSQANRLAWDAIADCGGPNSMTKDAASGTIEAINNGADAYVQAMNAPADRVSAEDGSEIARLFLEQDDADGATAPPALRRAAAGCSGS